jgi:hypothetical protein
MNDQLTAEEARAVRKRILRIQEQGWGIAFGLMAGLGLFVATNILVLRGGPVVGPRLALLALYFPGYRVTFLGSVIGFVYAFVLGYAVGRGIATIYNRLTEGRH